MLRHGFTWPLIVPASVLAASMLSALCEIINHNYLERKEKLYQVHPVSSLELPHYCPGRRSLSGEKLKAGRCRGRQ